MGMISLTQEREAVIDFSVPFYFDSVGFVAPLPKDLPKYQAIFRPFSHIELSCRLKI
jgi:ABC-type amino acid transport substrate-binding protein